MILNTELENPLGFTKTGLEARLIFNFFMFISIQGGITGLDIFLSGTSAKVKKRLRTSEQRHTSDTIY